MARPKKEIDWKAVEEQMEAGLTAKQISHGKIHVTRFYGKFKEKYGCDFASYANDSYDCGDGKLKFIQYKKAIEGRPKELEKLCDIRLGQASIKQEAPPNDEFLAIKHENMILKAEIQKIKESYDNHE